MIEVELKSNELKNDICLNLGKNEGAPIYIEELEKIEELNLNKFDLVGDETDETILDLIFFKNLKECTLSNMDIDSQEIQILNKLKKLEILQLNNCNIKSNLKFELNLKILILNKCDNVKIDNYIKIDTLEKLQIVNCENIDLNGISKLENLKEVLFQNLEINNIDEIKELKKLKILNLNGTKIGNLDEIYKIPDLYVEHEENNYIYDNNDEEN